MSTTFTLFMNYFYARDPGFVPSLLQSDSHASKTNEPNNFYYLLKCLILCCKFIFSMLVFLCQQKQVGDKWEFSCQHGPMECLGNLIQVESDGS